jgi:UDP-N-acetylmuramate--alanine ligase
MNQSQTYNFDSRKTSNSMTALHGANKKRTSIFIGDQATALKNKIMVAGKKIHLIGAGGVGMSGLAALLLKNNAIVTGSDQTSTNVTDRLCRLGADIKIGHAAENLDPQTDAVVISAAVQQDNPELQTALQQDCRVYKYAEMLGELMSFYEGIAVAGTHGKSTTSGWLTYLLKQTGIDTNFIIGAEIIQLSCSSGIADSSYFVAEACEYDRSFLNLKPKIACVLNIEQDHLDYYRDENEIVEAFEDFVHGTRPNGVVIANGQDSNVAKIIRHLPDNVHYETFGLDQSCDFYADSLSVEDGFYSFDVYHYGALLGRTTISLPGRHNIYNALAVVAMAVNLRLGPEQVLEFLGGFTGMDRRLMLKGRYGHITVLDDYAHHPTEIRASLAAIRQRYQPNRLWCIFQPHQYSRTRFLLDDFTESFKLADVTIVPEIYFVRDSLSSKQQINARILVERLKGNRTEAMFIDNFGAICEHLRNHVGPGDVVVTMGAGDIWKVADEYIQWLRRDC